jgi:hypothetical protein
VKVHAAKAKASIHRQYEPGSRRETGGNGRSGSKTAIGVVVAQVTVTLVPKEAGFGEAVQVVSEGAPLIVKLTVPVNPPSLAVLRLYVAVCPGSMVADVEEPEPGPNEKS